eukprot:CAMPEP_0201622542 /NCGR_PEP_ID=MMETSP0492-20130828/47455_1 /ASSEMBLY_ACC=CAM_ASM_000837 /TAXON_ID=420259 /ORGANISM="Thalassiosira gravida, Strain GMp14c1" /LENGTH=470 /DNA_ID=CAMNT_0048092127 /DNA_START=1564 /DNA_END=2976 /DNA_ORIENTATION=-
MAWMQVVWKLNILPDEDTLMVISFFAWLVLCAVVHTLFIWHTLKTEESESTKMKEERNNNASLEDEEHEDSRHTTSTKKASNKQGKKKSMRRTSSYDSYSSFIFDPRTHFKDGTCQFADHPDVEDDFTNELTSEVGLPPNIECDNGKADLDSDLEGFCIETPVETETGNVVMEFDDDQIIEDLNPTTETGGLTDDTAPNATVMRPKAVARHAAKSSCAYPPNTSDPPASGKLFAGSKSSSSHFPTSSASISSSSPSAATSQIKSTRAGLPAVGEALYNHMNEGPVCAFDNRGANSNIITFEDKDAAHAAGSLVVHCGACGACSSWENLIIEYTTRDTMAALANECAKTALFGGGDDAVAECLMDPKIGFEEQCAICWMEDILCTKKHCAFIFLQSQMINNVGNFAVGEGEITSASCEEAHCEVGQFVPCSGATRRRMNIGKILCANGYVYKFISDLFTYRKCDLLVLPYM